jgi:hypothetical protein
MAERFDKGDRVSTPYGAAEVQYRRMQPPDYSEVACYSVRLMAQWHDCSYSGTIVPAAEVSRLDNWCNNCKACFVSMDPEAPRCHSGRTDCGKVRA